jgi:hypothetical protein
MRKHYAPWRATRLVRVAPGVLDTSRIWLSLYFARLASDVQTRAGFVIIGSIAVATECENLFDTICARSSRAARIMKSTVAVPGGVHRLD